MMMMAIQARFSCHLRVSRAPGQVVLVMALEAKLFCAHYEKARIIRTMGVVALRTFRHRCVFEFGFLREIIMAIKAQGGA